MFQLIVNPNFQKAMTSGAVQLFKIGTLTVASVWLSRATHEAGKNLIAEMTQHYRIIKHQMSV
ncbi:hypothetical protein DCCM_1985 [Desulfocucumis palustris]|uniref:Uncharacterized protein n=1 Tax=Desulfocucumis palustris TaxID=1898651 RepID=A0A2L2X9R8_9FIRM|nr:hypothetical protein [Desulfocucumis palustris]GBF32888.1 hypothetical protein DCCM_1985 [Desulfocucumis palustris]